MWPRSSQSIPAVLICVLAGLARAAAPSPDIPDTPAGHALGAWLDAFNSGDRARQESFIEAYPSWMKLDDIAKWSAEVGGYDLLDVYSSDSTNVFFRMKRKSDAVEEAGRMQVSGSGPAALIAFGTRRLPAGAKFEPVMLDDAERARVVELAAGAFDESYIDPAIGKKMSAALRKNLARGEYREIRFGEVFAGELTRELQEISHDKHAEVSFSYFVRPAETPAQQFAAESRHLAAINCGFQKAEHLAPNIGYLKFDTFADVAICAPTASAAMSFLADSDALIVDLRDNHGGGGGMVEFIASYLFAARTHLDDFFTRTRNATEETWTLPYVPGRKFIGKPVFVLTSKQTFSAAEYLANVLRNLQRATLVGETTGGGAHTVEDRRVDDHFSIRVPTGRPITKTDWEGKGVEPDVKTVADQALEVALKLAVEEIRRDRKDASAVTPDRTDPIRLPLTFVQSTPVTTILVGGQAVQAIVDISGGDADGALTLSKDAIENAKGMSLGTALANDAFGRKFTRPRFEVSGVTIGGRTFQKMRVVQAVMEADGVAPPVSNAIGKHFLSRYFVVVDYAGASISLWPPDTKNPAGVNCGNTRIPMLPTEEERLAVSDFDTSSGRVRLLWGTGSSYSMLPETTAEKLRLTTVTRGPGSPKFYESKTLSAAGQALGPLEFAVLPLALPRDFEGVLGANFFDHHVVCLDYERRAVRVRQGS